MSLPFVSIIMPVRNEEAMIGASIKAVLAQDYAMDRMEILVADGESTDNTREIVRTLAETLALPIRIIRNPKKLMASGFNLAIKQAQGDVVIMLGGHCEITSNYVRQCVEVLKKTGADCVGGALITVGLTKQAQAIALAQSSPFGVGGVSFRMASAKAAFVDTVAFGAYRREVYDRIGLLDEEMVRNQDDEFNFRLLQAGGKIWLEPSLKVRYYARSSLCKLWRQYLQYGLYKVRVIQKRKAVPSWRHLVPVTFVVALFASWVLAGILRFPLLALSVAGPYIMVNLLASLWIGRRNPRTLLFLPLAFTILHIAYGLGFLWGLWCWRKQWASKT